MVITVTGVITRTQYTFAYSDVKGVAFMKGADMDNPDYPEEFVRVIFKKPIQLQTIGRYEAVDVLESYDQLNQQLRGNRTAN